MTTVAAPISAEGDLDCSLYEFVVWSVGGVVCVLGFVGNLIAFIVFQKDPKKTSTSFLLQVCGAMAERRPDLRLCHRYLPTSDPNNPMTPRDVEQGITDNVRQVFTCPN